MYIFHSSGTEIQQHMQYCIFMFLLPVQRKGVNRKEQSMAQEELEDQQLIVFLQCDIADRKEKWLRQLARFKIPSIT